VAVTPSVLKRITPLWSVKNVRWPVEADEGAEEIVYDEQIPPTGA